MQLTIYKARLPKGLSYVLKTSQVEDALSPLDIDINVQLNFRVSRAGETGTRIFECYYWLPNANVPYNRFYINIGTVHHDDKILAASLMTTTAIIAFTKWVKFIALLPANSTLVKHDSYFKVIFNGGTLTIISDVVVD